MKYFKYPRTPHLPFSLGATDDDKMLSSVAHFEGKTVVITEKLDGENTTIAYNKIHARSLDSSDHVSRHWVKAAFGWVSKCIPSDYKICGENVFAEHSIPYVNLESYFYGFSVWNKFKCLSWDDTLAFFNQYNIISVPILYVGIWDESICKNLIKKNTEKGLMEGLVVRTIDEIHLNEFSMNFAKWVRKDHVTTDEHWMNRPVIKNKLKEC